MGLLAGKFRVPRAESVSLLRIELAPLRAMLQRQPFIADAQPMFADYIVFGVFQWARSMSPLKLLEPDDPVYQWRGRLLDAFGGYARQAVGYDV